MKELKIEPFDLNRIVQIKNIIIIIVLVIFLIVLLAIILKKKPKYESLLADGSAPQNLFENECQLWLNVAAGASIMKVKQIEPYEDKMFIRVEYLNTDHILYINYTFPSDPLSPNPPTTTGRFFLYDNFNHQCQGMRLYNGKIYIIDNKGQVMYSDLNLRNSTTLTTLDQLNIHPKKTYLPLSKNDSLNIKFIEFYQHKIYGIDNQKIYAINLTSGDSKWQKFDDDGCELDANYLAFHHDQIYAIGAENKVYSKSIGKSEPWKRFNLDYPWRKAAQLQVHDSILYWTNVYNDRQIFKSSLNQKSKAKPLKNLTIGNNKIHQIAISESGQMFILLDIGEIWIKPMGGYVYPDLKYA